MMTTLGKRRIVERATEGRSHHIFSPSYPCPLCLLEDISCPGHLCKKRAKAKKGPVYFPFSAFHLILALNWLTALKKMMWWMLHSPQGALHKLPLAEEYCQQVPLKCSFWPLSFLSLSFFLFVSKVTLCVQILKWQWVTNPPRVGKDLKDGWIGYLQVGEVYSTWGKYQIFIQDTSPVVQILVGAPMRKLY